MPGEPVEDSGRRPATLSTTGAWLILVAGVLGLIASATLTIEKIELLINPAYVPSCNLNPVVACGSVMTTPQASAFGFPNSLIGIAAFAVVTLTGVLAVAKVPLPRWYWIGMTIGTLLGTAFVHWLIFQSLYRIGALCPYCMVVWVATLSLLVVVSSVAFGPSDDRQGVVVHELHHWRWSIATIWFTVVFLLIVVRFWDYWSTLI
ncbi:vitamin K epoxide reductase family protein [Mycobacterium paraterrae]|uniref:Vitamin K epoxide reductase family protein n=1 Tax=Mycobacterium paraterrae TaxID=577492 RepID=A0ABY3VSD5_9MYCO|nr:vitamin K epoxide reductase family protein [Mycobacterium paraterrae]UMB72363.1 vitamin K epoxide reductase family protein [Mycobacterium paraterrae]